MAKFDLKDDSVVVVIGSGAGGGTLGSHSMENQCRASVVESLQGSTMACHQAKTGNLPSDTATLHPPAG